MISNLNENEMRIATKLIFDGLSMAKSSMEQILQSPITIEKIEYNDQVGTHRFHEGGSGDVHLIQTDLMGELKGTSHLIFSESEVNKLYKSCLPDHVTFDDSPESTIMKLGFLTEIDNMVAAAVITEFSNFLGVEIYGMVPSLKVMKADEVNAYLDAQSTEKDSVIHFKAVFHGKDLGISPDFVWVFHDKLVDKIKGLA
jgi:chemotaxis protein CheY-P-specific phosphatase CheC